MDAKRHPLALGEQCRHGDDDALGGVERGDLGRRVLAQRVEAQALGGARLQQAGERRRALLVVMKDADEKRVVLGLAGEGRGGLEHARRGLLGVVEHQQRRSVARAGLGDGRQRPLGEFATADVEDRGALALDLGRELGHEPCLADPRRPPDHHADDPALARPAPARAQPVKLALASGEHRRAALELHRQLDDRRRCVEGRVLGQDLLLQALQLGPGLDPDLLGERPVGLAVGIERLRLAPVAIEGEHALRVRALSQRLVGDQRLEPDDRLGVAPRRELGVDRQLRGPHVKLLQPADLWAGKRLGGDVGERGAAPELERGGGQAVRPGARRLASGLLDQLLEAQGVDGARGQAQLVAATAGEDLRLGAALAEHLAQPRDVDVEVLGGARGEVIPPQPVGQLIAAEGRVGVKREHRNDAALLASPQGKGVAIDQRLDGAKKANLEGHGEPVAATVPPLAWGVNPAHRQTTGSLDGRGGELTAHTSAPIARDPQGGGPQLAEAVGETGWRRRTVSSAAPPSAANAMAAPAPTRALPQSNPSPELDGEPETSVGSLAAAPVIAFTDE